MLSVVQISHTLPVTCPSILTSGSAWTTNGLPSPLSFKCSVGGLCKHPASTSDSCNDSHTLLSALGVSVCLSVPLPAIAPQPGQAEVSSQGSCIGLHILESSEQSKLQPSHRVANNITSLESQNYNICPYIAALHFWT